METEEISEDDKPNERRKKNSSLFLAARKPYANVRWIAEKSFIFLMRCISSFDRVRSYCLYEC